MQRIAAVHDGSAQGWETVYLAIHVATRLGTPLLVLTLNAEAAEWIPSEQSEKIHTSGHAAGIAVETYSLDQLSPEAILRQAGELYTILLPKNLAGEESFVPELASALGCPVWLVSLKYDLRRLGVCLETGSEKAASHYATALARRLGQPVVFFTTQVPVDGPAEEDVSWRALEELSVDGMVEQVSLGQIDMLVFGTKELSFFQHCRSALDCVLVFCPGAEDNSLN